MLQGFEDALYGNVGIVSVCWCLQKAVWGSIVMAEHGCMVYLNLLQNMDSLKQIYYCRFFRLAIYISFMYELQSNCIYS